MKAFDISVQKETHWPGQETTGKTRAHLEEHALLLLFVDIRRRRLVRDKCKSAHHNIAELAYWINLIGTS
jgi:hypothetical protein